MSRRRSAKALTKQGVAETAHVAGTWTLAVALLWTLILTGVYVAGAAVILFFAG